MALHTSSCPVASHPFLSRPCFGRKPARRHSLSTTAAAAIPIPQQYKKMLPKGDLVLAKVADAEEKTTGGILLPTASQKKPTSGDVVELGDGSTGAEKHQFQLKVGDTIIYSKFGIGITDVQFQDQEHALLREDDVIGILPRSGSTAADLPEIRPLGDRVLLKVQEQADVSAGGVLLPSSAKERPISGRVVRTGPGKLEKDGKRKAIDVQEGDQVLYFKYAGDPMETPDGSKYVVVHESDLLCKT
ncbi:hypothetical protein WJX84_012122 [Apatococcus fuscideae]|uniref:20 kDa chaperonin, chloroplastic n=1 Tax=Apatococcus fuscideae TaxID=2026836 RepID=A0AAW1RKX3_9CHLO